MSSNEVEQIKDRLDIVDVVSSYIKVEKSGINWKAKCPFHNEKTASFFISSPRQSFYCFGCGEKGDIFSFVQKIEGLDFMGSLEILASRAGVELKKYKRDSDDKDGREREKLFEILEVSTVFFQKNLEKKSVVKNYLKKRGLSHESIDKWRIGYAEDEWRSLHDYLLSSGFTKEKMLEVGLVKKVPEQGKPARQTSGSESDRFYDTFRDRIIFPLSDSAGRIIAFSGRSMKNDDKTPKYLNSPETKLFYKSEVLYGYHLAKEWMRKRDYAVLVEGQIDLCMSHQAGVQNTVATSGTAVTELHLKKIQKITNRLIIGYDSDESGHKAARRAGELALALGMEVKIAELDDGEDPASVILKDPELWKNSLREAVNFLDFELSKALAKKIEKDVTKEITKNLLPLVSLLRSEIEKSQFVKKISSKIGVPEEAVWNDLRKVKTSMPEAITGLKNKLDIAPRLDRTLSGLIFLLVSKKDADSKKLLKEIKQRWQSISDEKMENFTARFETMKEALVFEAENFLKVGNTEDVLKNILDRLELQKLKEKITFLALELDNKKITKVNEKKASEEMGNVQKRIKELEF